MSSKNNPGPFDCYAAAEPSEPMFILLGRDVHAPALVEEWANARMTCGEAPEKVKEAREIALDMRAWCMRLGKTSKLLAKPKWVVIVSNLEEYHTVLCYTDAEMENAYITAQQGDCHPEGSEEGTQFEAEMRSCLRDSLSWSGTPSCERTRLEISFEHSIIEILRLK
jgi:hypothetical protein